MLCRKDTRGGGACGLYGKSGSASLAGGRLSRDLTQSNPSPRLQVLRDHLGGSDLSPPLSASPPCSRHTDLLAVPQTCQARSYLRTFSLSVPSARKPLPPDLRAARVLTSFRSLLQCPLLREALPAPPPPPDPHTAPPPPCLGPPVCSAT